MSSPLAFFGAELRRARLAAGMTQDRLGDELGYSGDQVGKVETCDRSPTDDFATRCDARFPQLDGLFMRLLEFARRWDAPYPQWFKDWLDAERVAMSLHSWEPLIIYGLLQTADYARAIFSADPEITEDELDERVAARVARQSILERPKPPELSVLPCPSCRNRHFC
jgi:transcriptional regulator with XRE-family HTH domain